jgi:transcriptional regulator GlxA family with amidase domain
MAFGWCDPFVHSRRTEAEMSDTVVHRDVSIDTPRARTVDAKFEFTVIDLCLSLVAEDWGNEMALRIARNLIACVRGECGQPPGAPGLAVGAPEGTIVGQVLRYVSDHIGEVLSIEQLAGALGVSRRTFSRRFARHTDVPPSVFVEQVRVDFARKLIEQSDVPLKTVAFRCGFHSATHMRMIFARRLDTTPKRYRMRCRGEPD